MEIDSDITVIKVDDQHYPQWDSYVSQSPNAPAYLRTGWKQAVEAAYQHKTHYFMALQNGHVVGVLPLVAISVPFSKTTLCSLPFCDVGGPIADTDQIEAALLQAAQALQNQLNATQAELRRSESMDVALSENELANKKVRMILPLPASAEELKAGFKSKLRSQIHKAEKNGLNIALGRTDKFVDDFYKVFSLNMRDLGSPVHAKTWFEALRQHYGDDFIVSVATMDGTVAGAGILLFNGESVSIPWASTDRNYNHLAPNMLLYWSLLAHATERGAKYFDFGRSTYGEGTYRFKKQWGAEPVPLNWEIQTLSGTTVTTNGQSGKIRDLVTSAWQKLPLSIANTVGPRIRRYISL